MLQASPMAGRLSPLSTSPSLLSADELQRTLTSVGDDGASWQLTRSPSSRSNLATSWLGMSGGHAPESPSRRLGLSHGIFDEDRRLNKKPTSKVNQAPASRRASYCLPPRRTTLCVSDHLRLLDLHRPPHDMYMCTQHPNNHPPRARRTGRRLVAGAADGPPWLVEPAKGQPDWCAERSECDRSPLACAQHPDHSTPRDPGSWCADTRCEAMRHVQSTLPAGNTAAERKAESRRLASQPARRARGLAMYAVPEPSRFALAGSIPQSHDLFYQKSAMPVSASMLSTH